MSCIETPEAPEWLSKLESQREKLSKARLGHDSGAGAACNTCGPKCPGLDLHFWRKICRSCHCSKDSHDVQDDDLPGWAQFELLGKNKPKRSGAILMKIRGLADEPVKLDWIPPNTSPDMVSDYMSCLGGELAPVVGSEGAAKRREQLRRQVPLHDIRSDLCCHTLTPQEQNSHQEYISKIKSHVVGIGNIVRIGSIKKGDTLTINLEGSHPVPGLKSYSLPLRVSQISNNIKYTNIPKSSSDKLLVLDNMGNIINKSGYLPDYKLSHLLSKNVKDKLNAIQIETDRIKSAVEHGPIYDKLFLDLRRLNIPIDNDVYLKPIKYFRLEYNSNPKFQNETMNFAESLGAKIMTLPSNSLNNNNDPVLNIPSTQNTYPQKGFIFGPNGEIWNWCSLGNVSKDKYSDQPKDIYQKEFNNIFGDEDMPPAPNYSTHPNLTNQNMLRSEPFLNVNKINDSDRMDPVNKADNKLHFDNSINNLIENIDNMSVNNIKDNSSVQSTCHRCNRYILHGEVAVKAERAGDNVSWHPQCFTCIKCHQLLADLVYFYHKDEIYCARDLAEELKIERCAACDELIFSRSYTMAEGKSFHPTHFCCYHCDTPLGDQHYVPDDKTGLPICLICYDKFHAAICHLCKNFIGPQQQGVSWSKFHWHGSCFICSAENCKKSLLQSKFVIKNEMPFCSSICVRNTII